MHTLGGDQARLQPRVRATPREPDAGGGESTGAAAPAGTGASSGETAVDAPDLAARLAALEARVADLEEQMRAGA